jgi:hypothetical protein
MIFMCQYQIDDDKKTDTQAFFASMTPEQIAGELPTGVKQIGRWHDLPNGCGWAVIESDDQETLTSWMMGWSGLCVALPLDKMVETVGLAGRRKGHYRIQPRSV